MGRKKHAKKKAAKAPLTASIFVLCDGVVGGPSDKTTIYGIFDVIWAKSFPVTLGPHHCFAAMKGSGEYNVKLVVVGPDGTEIEGTPPAVKIQCASNSSSKLDFLLAGLRIPKAGQYVFELREGRRVLARCEANIKRPPSNRSTKKKK